MTDTPPVLYEPEVAAEVSVDELWDTLPWEQREGAPRRECWMNDFNQDYTYGSGRGERTYKSKEWHEVASRLQFLIYKEVGYYLEGCFCNGYLNEQQHLGWHSDDSPEMDDKRPIVVFSFGAERYIHFRRIGAKGPASHMMKMGHGSMLVMGPGLQLEWEHKNPKHSEPCGKRVSLTYRAYI